MDYRDAWGEGLHRSCGCGPSVGAVWARRLPWPTRSRLRWCAPIRTIRSSTRSARRCAPPTKTCRRPCRAIARRSRSPPAPAINTPIRNTTAGGTPNAIVRTEIHGANAPRSVGAHGLADALQRPADRQQDPRRGEPGLRLRAKRLRVLEQTVLLSARHHLHGLSARFRHRRGSAQQRPRARTDAEADPRSLQCRRGHPHRRRAVGSAACRRQDAAADRRSQSDDDARELPPHHRQRAGGACAGLAGRSLPAADAAAARSSSA